MVKLSEDLFAVPDGEIYPKRFRAGEDVSGSVAQAAEDQGKIATKGKAIKPPENK